MYALSSFGDIPLLSAPSSSWWVVHPKRQIDPVLLSAYSHAYGVWRLFSFKATDLGAAEVNAI